VVFKEVDPTYSQLVAVPSVWALESHQLTLAAQPYSYFFMRLVENQQRKTEEAKFYRVRQEEYRLPFSGRLAFFFWLPQREVRTSYLLQDPPFLSLS